MIPCLLNNGLNFQKKKKKNKKKKKEKGKNNGLIFKPNGRGVDKNCGFSFAIKTSWLVHEFFL